MKELPFLDKFTEYQLLGQEKLFSQDSDAYLSEPRGFRAIKHFISQYKNQGTKFYLQIPNVVDTISPWNRFLLRIYYLMKDLLRN